MTGDASIVLASGSATRRAMLEAAGLRLVIDKPDVDEEALKREFQAASKTASDAALGLAAAKAARVAARHAGRIVVGADQMLECERSWFDKPVDRASAARQLRSLSGRTHVLISAVVAVRDTETLWQTIDSAELTMRPLSDVFVESYLDRIGDRALGSVGGYQVEGLGIQLFERIRGDHFTILGMPLLPLLGFLRRHDILPT